MNSYAMREIMDDMRGMQSAPISQHWFVGMPVESQSNITLQLEKLFYKIVKSTELAYLFTSADIVFTGQETGIGSQLRQCMPLIATLSPGYDYSEALASFLSSIWISRGIYGVSWDQLAAASCISSKEAINEAVMMMRQRYDEPNYRILLKRRAEEIQNRAKSLASYTRSVLSERSRTLVVRVDLSYLESAQIGLTVDQAFEHRMTLIETLQRSDLCEHLTGYAWAWHQGTRKGFHLHTVFFFDGSRVCRDIDIGHAIGTLWQQITHWGGIFHNCNINKERYERCGIGMISRSDTEQCENTIHAVCYLGIQEGHEAREFAQYMRIKPIGARVFGKGGEPDGPVRMGRPPLKRFCNNGL